MHNGNDTVTVVRVKANNVDVSAPTSVNGEETMEEVGGLENGGRGEEGEEGEEMSGGTFFIICC
jgi:hypothetical protein